MPAGNMYPEALKQAMQYFSRLPGVGRRSAERMALAVLDWPEEQCRQFGELLRDLPRKIHPCRQCGNFTEDDLCPLCRDETRQQDALCIVEQATQIPVIEGSGCFRGRYLVLGGKLSPLSGRGPESLNLAMLRARLDGGDIKEVILATSADVEGEATASFLVQELAPYSVTVSRIAFGVPVGSDVSYSDSATMAMALSGRRIVKRPDHD